MINDLKIARQKLELKSRLEVTSQIQSRIDEYSSLEDEYSKFSCKMAKTILENFEYIKTEDSLLSFIQNTIDLSLSQDDPEKISIISQIGSSLLLIKI